MSYSALNYLQAHLLGVDALLERAASRAESAGHDPTDALRGLVITREEAERQLSLSGVSGQWDIENLPVVSELLDLPELPIELDSPLAYLLNSLGLDMLDAWILLVAAAPDLNYRYERLYGYLQDDVTLRRPTVNLAMNLLGSEPEQRFEVWKRLTSSAPLRRWNIIDLTGDQNRPNASLLTATLRIDPRIVRFLLGSDQPDERIRLAVRRIDSTPSRPPAALELAPLHDGLESGAMIFFKAAPDRGQVETAAALCLPLLHVDLARLYGEAPHDPLLMTLITREALLQNAGLMLNAWDTLLVNGRPASALWETISDLTIPVFLSGTLDFEPQDIGRSRRLLRVTFELPDFTERLAIWRWAADSIGAQASSEQLEELAAKFRFTSDQILRATQTAADIAATRATAPQRDDLYAGAQAHAALNLGQLAQLVTPRAVWNDLILPPDPTNQLREICDRMRFAHIVNQEWGFGRRGKRGLSALFAGESGTGKTLAAEVIAHQLGLSMYKIDLSAVVSKFIGETEKNLGSIFTEAEAGNAILFFDEADAIFGKRSEVKDAHDRYANLEIAYLLQRMESYDGIVILATNFRHNIDEAFTRRLDFLIDFPFPDADHRRKIWEVHVPAQAPLAPNLSFGEIAAQHRLSGGNIRNVMLAAAYLAAADGKVISEGHLRSAIRREHQKMGKLLED